MKNEEITKSTLRHAAGKPRMNFHTSELCNNEMNYTVIKPE
jgi:hypothetical protein